MNAPFYLGRCLFENDRYTRLEPLLRVEQGGWMPIPNRRRIFPEVGCVFAVERPIVGSTEGSLWLFRPEANTRLKPGDERDLYVAVDPREPIQIVDLAGLGEIEAVRRAVVEEGLAQREIVARELLIVIAQGQCVRLRLDLDHNTHKWRPAEPDKLERLAVFEFDPGCYAGAKLDQKCFVIPGREPDKKLSAVDWSSDFDFLPRILKKLKRTAPLHSGGDMQEFSRRAIERMVSALRDGEILATEPEMADAMLRRLQNFVPALEKRLDAVSAIAEALAATPAVTASIATHVAKARERAIDEMRNEFRPIVEAELKAEQAQALENLQMIETDIAALQAEHDRIKQDLAELQLEREVQQAALHDDLRHIAGTLDKATNALQRGSETAVRLGLLPSAGTGSQDLAPWACSSDCQGDLLELPQLRTALNEAERSAGLPDHSLLELDVLARAGEIPLIFGADAERALTRYASIVAGGDLFRSVLDPTTLGIDDIWRQPSTGSPAVFAQAWRAALKSPGQIILAVLDNVDVHHLLSWMPRLASFCALNRPANLLIVATPTLRMAGEISGNEVLSACLPFEVDGGAAAAAALVSEVCGQTKNGTSRLRGAPMPPLDTSHIQRLMREILAIPRVHSTAAGRAVRILRAALATMHEDEAFALARSSAAIQRVTSGSPGTSIDRSLDSFLKCTS
jgi:hypothetical protein